MLSTEYLERARKLTTTGSDYALAKLLGLSEQAVHSYRHGHRIIDNYAALRLAELLEEPLEAIIAAAEIDRAKTPEKAQKWRDRLKAHASTASAILAFCAVAGTTGDANAAPDRIDSTDYGITQSEKTTNAKAPLYKLYASTLYRFCAKFAAYTSARCRSLRSRTPRAGRYATA